MNGLVGRVSFAILLLAMAIVVPASSPAAAYRTDSSDAMDQAYYLSVLEANGQFNALYDLIHPDAHAVVPRAAVIGWYNDNFAPRGAYPATILGVEFVTWTWEVTGKTYYRTAEVSFSQLFWDGGQQNMLYDVVRLVQDDYGTWRWFFGRTRAFVQEQIALYAQPYPQGTLLNDAVTDIAGFWGQVFYEGDLWYDEPSVMVYTGYATSACGSAGDGPGSYCPRDMTIYINEQWYFWIVGELGDFAWVTVVAHEWGHHVQEEFLDNGVALGLRSLSGVQSELMADCLAGVYTQDAETRGLLQTGDVSEAVQIAILAGDPDHGSGDDRVTAFMYGYLGGLVGCGIEI